MVMAYDETIGIRQLASNCAKVNHVRKIDSRFLTVCGLGHFYNAYPVQIENMDTNRDRWKLLETLQIQILTY